MAAKVFTPRFVETAKPKNSCQNERGLSEEAPRCRRGFGILNALVQGPFSLILAALPNNFHFG